MCEICFLDGGIKSPFQRRQPKDKALLMKKQVKFTDEPKCVADALTTVPEKEDSKESSNEADLFQGLLDLKPLMKF